MQTKQRLDLPLTIKSVSDSGEFEGYGSVFGVEDSYGDVVIRGAFAVSLAKWKEKSRLPAMLWQHNMSEPIGIYTEMREDDVGLYVKGQYFTNTSPVNGKAIAEFPRSSAEDIDKALDAAHAGHPRRPERQSKAFLADHRALERRLLDRLPGQQLARLS